MTTNEENMTYAIFTANGIETARTTDELAQHGIEGDPVTVMLIRNSVLQKFYMGNGGQAPTYKIQDNATLTIYRGDEVHLTYGPAAWALVKGPAKIRR